MTKEEFSLYWKSRYPNTLPISYHFKTDYHHRWLRIYNLPGSKRYAESKEEKAVILHRQNLLICDLLGEEANILLITGEFTWGEPSLFKTDDEEVFHPYTFQRLDDIDLFAALPNEFAEGQLYRYAFAETQWIPKRFDSLLEKIADDFTSAFFASPEQNILIAPYDGGIDLILPDSSTRDHLKYQYKDWLSLREDGL